MGCEWNEWVEGKYVVVVVMEVGEKEGAGKRTDASWGFSLALIADFECGIM